MRETSASRIPNFLVAADPQGLRRLMIQNNLRLQAEILYSDIQYANGKWYAWFYENLADAEALNVAIQKIKRAK